MSINYILLLLPFLISCDTEIKHGREDIIGRYVSKSPKTPNYYVEVRSDNTFKKYYKGADGEYMHSGRWQYDSTSGQLSLAKWKNFGPVSASICRDEGCYCSVYINSNGELLFDMDMDESNFQKE